MFVQKPPIKDLTIFNVPEINSIDSLIPIYYLLDNSQHFVKIDLVFGAGEVFSENPLIANLTNSMILESCEGYSSSEINELFDYYGAEMVVNTGMYNSTISLLCLSKHLAKLLDIIHKLITTPSFDEHDFIRIKENKQKQFLIDLENVNFLAKRQFKKIIFNDNSKFSRNIEYEDFNLVTPEQLRNNYLRLYGKNNLKIFVSGNVDINFLKEKISNFKMHEVDVTDIKFLESKQTLGQKIYIEKQDALQSAIRIGCLSIPQTHPDYYPLYIAVAMLGGYFGSRLMQELREKQGYTYGIGSFLVAGKGFSYMVITTEVNADVTKNAVNAIYQVINDFCNTPISEEELLNVKAYLKGELLRTFDGCFNVMETFKNVNYVGLTLNEYLKLWHTIMTIDTKKIQKVAQKYLLKPMHEVVVGRYN